MGNRPAKFKEKKSDRELELFVGRRTSKFFSGGEKMRNTSGHQGDNERVYHISSIKRVTRKFLEVSRCGRANNGKEMYKKVCCTYKVVFLLIRPTVVFSPFSLPSPLKVMLHGTICKDDF